MNAPTLIALSGVLLCGCGCSAPSAQTPAADAPPGQASTSPATAVLPIGSSSEAVRQALGTPHKIDPVAGNPAATLWTYYRPIEKAVRLVETSMQDMPVADITNRQTGMAIVQVPVQHLQETILEEVLVLLLVNDQLTEWRRSHRQVAGNQAIR